MRLSLPPIVIISAASAPLAFSLLLNLYGATLPALGQTAQWQDLRDTARNAEMRGDAMSAVSSYKKALPFAENIGLQSAQLTGTLLSIAANQAILQHFDAKDNTYQRGFQLALTLKTKGTIDKDVLESLDTLSQIYSKFSSGPYQYVATKRRCEIITQFFGLKHPRALEALSERADTCMLLKKYKEAESICQFVLQHASEIRPKDRSGLSRIYCILAVLAEQEKKPDEARGFLLKALEVQKPFGPDYLLGTGPKFLLGRLYVRQGKTAEGRKLLADARRIALVGLETAKERPKPDWGTFVGIYNCLANVYCEEKNYTAAETYFRKTIFYMDKFFGSDNLHLAETCDSFARMLRAKGNRLEAAKLQSRAKTIVAKHLQELSSFK